MTNMLRKLGIDAKHEDPSGEDGLVSYMHAYLYPEYPIVLQQVREPITVIRTLLSGYLTTNKDRGWVSCEQYIDMSDTDTLPIFPPDYDSGVVRKYEDFTDFMSNYQLANPLGDVHRAFLDKFLKFYIRWTEYVESANPVMRYKIEELELHMEEIAKHIGFDFDEDDFGFVMAETLMAKEKQLDRLSMHRQNDLFFKRTVGVGFPLLESYDDLAQYVDKSLLISFKTLTERHGYEVY
jgi:hypothetical protein